jgi:hypothetical protein
MNRRAFVATGLSSLLTYNCNCSRRAIASTAIQGCRMASMGSAAFAIRFLDQSGDSRNDRERPFYTDRLSTAFNVRAATRVYDDHSGANAMATPEPIFSDGPDGTVMLGVNLLAMYRRRAFDCQNRINEEMRKPGHILSLADADARCAFWRFVWRIIMAHEFGHILQYKRGMKPEGPWLMEPHADFLAGWFFGREKAGPDPDNKEASRILAEATYNTSVKAIFEMGDTFFDDPGHHGEPAFRTAMVRAGYDAADLAIDAAFQKGQRLLNLD